MDKVRKVLRGVDFDSAKFESIVTTPIRLYSTTDSCDVDEVREVLTQTGYSVDSSDSIGWTPLHYACAVGNLAMVTMLISEFKADTTIQDVNG